MAVYNRAKQRAFVIEDRPLLAREVMRIVKREFEGNLSEAARSIGMSQPQLYRIAREQSGGMQSATLKKLVKLMPEASRGVLDRAILTPQARSRLRRYYDFYEGARSESHWKRRRIIAPIRLRPPSRKQFAKKMRSERDVLWRHLKEKFPYEFRSLERIGKERGHDPTRVGFAWEAVVEPLLLGPLTGGIERDWRELSDTEMVRFIRAGIAREKIVLNRSPDIQRAQQLDSHRSPRGQNAGSE